MERIINRLGNIFTSIGLISTSSLVFGYFLLMESNIHIINLSNYNKDKKEDYKAIVKRSRLENKKLMFKLLLSNTIPSIQHLKNNLKIIGPEVNKIK